MTGATNGGKAVLLTFINRSLPDHAETVSAVKAYGAEHSDEVSVVLADPQQDGALASRCSVASPLRSTDVVIMINGCVVLHSRAPRTKAEVANAFQYARARSRCPCAGGWRISPFSGGCK